jgi:isocitrate dehydrogenase
MIPDRGTQAWPPAGAEPDLVDDYRCRFVPRDATQPLEGPELLARLQAVGLDHRSVHVEKLQDFDGVQGFAAAQERS